MRIYHHNCELSILEEPYPTKEHNDMGFRILTRLGFVPWERYRIIVRQESFEELSSTKELLNKMVSNEIKG